MGTTNQNVDKTKSFLKAKDVALIGLFTALLAVCSYVSIPTVVPFTLQTLAVFLALGCLGGKRGTIAIALYILMGSIGIPVFSGFKGGFGVILGPTGGYIVGFILTGLLYWGAEKLLGKKFWVMAVLMLLGAVTYFAFGTVWFMIVYLNTTGPIGLLSVLEICVIPFILPDLAKITVALLVSYKLKDKLI